ncbi:MAG: restriction endonuclease subunit S [Verrucomicrobiota bacterium]
MSFPRYPKYKPSGVEWLGEVPEHWEVKPLKVVASFNDEVLSETFGADEEIEYVDIGSVSFSGGIERTETMLFGNAPSRARRKVRDGDVIASTVRTYLKAIAPVIDPPSNMIVSTGFAVIRPGLGMVHHFGKFSLQTNYFVDAVISRSTGVSYPAINASEMAGISITLPPVSEQTRIAAFLDAETAKIDELVAEQRRLMDLLKEKRQAVISHAVTKGLNPNARMKHSGIEWLGEVPEHWDVERGRFLYQKLEIPPGIEDGVVTAFRDGQVTLRANRRTEGFTFAVLEVGYQRVRVGDLVIHGMDAFAGAIGVSESTGKCTPEYSVLTPARPGIDNRYFAMILRLMAQRNFVFVICPSVRERAPRFRFEAFKDVPLPVPPIEEQQEIMLLIESVEEETRSLTAEAQRAIDLLQERRSALISTCARSSRLPRPSRHVCCG